jgi:hypothetical protein
MANMSYCRFENTYHDLNDCYRNIDDTDLSETEARFRKRLIELCQLIGEVADPELVMDYEEEEVENEN